MSGFLLSPGITPELTDIFVTELPIALGLGYLLGRRVGFEFAFALNALVLGIIKLVTDYSDLEDDAVSLAAILGGIFWMASSRGLLDERRGLRGLVSVLGLLFVLIGLLKLQDFYDPFDLLLADLVIVSGIALWVFRRGCWAAPAARPPDSSSGA